MRGDKCKNKRTRKLQKSKAWKTKTRKWDLELNTTNVSSGGETRRKKTLKNKNKELKIGVRGIALDKGKGKARQSWQNKRLSKTIKRNKTQKLK